MLRRMTVDAVFITFMFVFPVALVLLLEKERYKAAGCLLTITGIGWACLWSQDPRGAPLMAHMGYSAAIIGALVYLHGVKRDIFRRMDEQKEDILKAIERATPGTTERTNTELGKRGEGG